MFIIDNNFYFLLLNKNHVVFYKNKQHIQNNFYLFDIDDTLTKYIKNDYSSIIWKYDFEKICERLKNFQNILLITNQKKMLKNKKINSQLKIKFKKIVKRLQKKLPLSNISLLALKHKKLVKPNICFFNIFFKTINIKFFVGDAYSIELGDFSDFDYKFAKNIKCNFIYDKTFFN